MEALSPTMEEGRLVKCEKHEGDTVKAGDTLAEVETDKAIMDLVARADGVRGQVAVKDGETVPVGKAIAVIAAPGETTGRGTGDEGRVATVPAPAPTLAPTVATPSPVSPPPSPAPAPADGSRVKASPLARRIAEQAVRSEPLRIWPSGRSKKDLEGVRQGSRLVPPAGAVPCPPSPSPVPRPCPHNAHRPYGRRPPPKSARPSRSARAFARSRPPLLLTTEVDMERAAEARDALNRR
jgi:pyruvate dehydrogenase E2 component (dihydrolipoamide acetyltransferase)